ncbi:MAG: hypothetical protein JSV83_09170, partial [Desulfobacterales bacterium]
PGSSGFPLISFRPIFLFWATIFSSSWPNTLEAISKMSFGPMTGGRLCKRSNLFMILLTIHADPEVGGSAHQATK